MDTSRALAASGGAAAVTFGLLWLMQVLVALHPVVVDAPSSRGTLDFIRHEAEPTLQLDDFEPIDKSFIDPPPSPRQRPPGGGDSIAVGQLPTPAPAPAGRDFEAGNAVPDGPLVAVLLVQPEYPQRAIAGGLAGWATVAFDVTTDGLTTNVRVVGSSHRVFEQPAIRAAERFRYKPRVVDGVALPASGLRYRFTFEMDN